MKKTLPICLLALALGGFLGFCLGRAAVEGPRPSFTLQAAAISAGSASAATEPAAELDVTNDECLLERGGQVLTALEAEDYSALAKLVHPGKGVRFTPYSTVDLEGDLVLTAERLAAGGTDQRVYTWGVVDGKGTLLTATIPEYFERYVANADYGEAPIVGMDTVAEVGNAQENAADAYPEGRFVEYHFPGLEEKNQGFDWCSLKLVFEPYQNDWRLVGVIHSEWTI